MASRSMVQALRPPFGQFNFSRSLTSSRILAAYTRKVFYGAKEEPLFFKHKNQKLVKNTAILRDSIIDPNLKTSEICDKILKFMAGPGKKAKKGLLVDVAQSVRTAKDLNSLKQVLERYHHKNIVISERVVYEIVKSCCAVDSADEALNILSKPKVYGLAPSRRVLESLLTRYGTEAKANPERLQQVMETWNMLQTTPGLEPTVNSRALLIRASVLAQSKEGAVIILRVLQRPEAEKDLVSSKGYLFWLIKYVRNVSGNKEKYADVVEPTLARLKELKKSLGDDYPRILDLAITK